MEEAAGGDAGGGNRKRAKTQGVVLPPHLVSIIKGRYSEECGGAMGEHGDAEATRMLDEDVAQMDSDAAAGAGEPGLTEKVSSLHMRSIRELGSYCRVVFIRLGLA